MLVLDPLCVLTPPKLSAKAIQRSLWMKLTVSLATRFDTSAQIIRQLIPKDSKFVQYGRIYQLEGGDTMHACELNPPQSDSCDMSFVQVCVNVCFRTLGILIFLLVSAFGWQIHPSTTPNIRVWTAQLLWPTTSPSYHQCPWVPKWSNPVPNTCLCTHQVS